MQSTLETLLIFIKLRRQKRVCLPVQVLGDVNLKLVTVFPTVELPSILLVLMKNYPTGVLMPFSC